MRRTAVNLAGVLAVVLGAGALLAKGSAESQTTSTLILEAWGEKKGKLASTGTAGGVFNYWGKLKNGANGSYRAICTWVPDKDETETVDEDRIYCTVVLVFGPVPSRGNMIAQGAVRLPQGNEGLFRRESKRPLLITGASGITGKSGDKYAGSRGVASIAGDGRISIRLTP